VGGPLLSGAPCAADPGPGGEPQEHRRVQEDGSQGDNHGRGVFGAPRAGQDDPPDVNGRDARRHAERPPTPGNEADRFRNDHEA